MQTKDKPVTSQDFYDDGYADGLEDAARLVENSTDPSSCQGLAKRIRALKTPPPANDNPDEIDTDNIGGLH